MARGEHPCGFEPIAIVGRGCILPGCANPDALWQTVAEGKIQIGAADPARWRVGMQRVVGGEPGHHTPDRTWSDVGGYVRGFDRLFDPASTRLDGPLVAQLDPVFQWSMYAAQQALAEMQTPVADGARAGLILGNLSYPTDGHNRYAEQEWMARITGRPVPPADEVHAWNRFMSGLPAMLVAKAFGLSGGAFALDAACASGLYAIKLACDRLQDGRADVMLAGAVNAADPLFLHVGFCALNALSRSGQSRPFHRDADGLVPAEGAAFVALKRLSDARADGNRILGVIRGVGLSNDGRSGGFLSPSSEGQVRCMEQALMQSGLRADQLQYVECHATGTPSGDAAEIASLAQVYGSENALPIGSLKANLGHLITTSGIAGLLKVLAAMEHGMIPATPGSRPLNAALGATRLVVPQHAMPWDACAGQRTAGLSSFGFGGNNAHLIVQQSVPATEWRAPTRSGAGEFAIVGLGLRTHLDRNATAFAQRVLGAGAPPADPAQGDEASVELLAEQLAFPPNDLKCALGQQLILLDIVREAMHEVTHSDSRRTAVYVGMQTDSQVCRQSMRSRLPDLLAQAGIEADAVWLGRMADAFAPPLDAASVIGTMPNIPANRLNNQFDIRGPGFVVSREELSGDTALELACSAIGRGEIDTAIVAAVDLCREAVHERAASAALAADRQASADGAVMLIIKALAHAERDGDPILGVIANASQAPAFRLGNGATDQALAFKLGHAHAASGLLQLAAASLMLRARTRLGADGAPVPLLANGAALEASVINTSFAGESAEWTVREAPATARRVLRCAVPPVLNNYAGSDPSDLAERIRAGKTGGHGACRLAIVAAAGQADAQRERALLALASPQLGDRWQLDGICFSRDRLGGELAFMFTGAAASYPSMGQDLLLGMPQLAEGLSPRLRDAVGAAGWAYDADQSAQAALPFDQLAGASFLSQLHMQLSREVLRLRPTAALGLSSGETNALFAFGAWNDMDGLFGAIGASGLYQSALASRFDAVHAHWGLAAGERVDWENYRVRANAADVAAAIDGAQRVYLTIINSPTDCVIGGDKLACKALLAGLGNPAAVPLGHDLAIHCAAVTPFEPAWRALHTRPTAPVPALRFYSNYLGGAYTPDQQSVADALTGQALQTIDFPKIVEQAWNDGVRIFVEHGPRNGLSCAIAEILADRSHVCVALDRPGVPGLVQAHRAAAQLWCAGVDVDLERLAAACAPGGAMRPLGGTPIRFRLRPPAPEPLSLARDAGIDPYYPPVLPQLSENGRCLPPAPALARLVAQPAAAVMLERARPAAKTVARDATPAQPGASMVAALLQDSYHKVSAAHQAHVELQQKAHQAYLTAVANIQAHLFQQAGRAASPRLMGPAVVPAGQQRPPPAAAELAVPSTGKLLPGPAFSRAQLEILASGKISAIFGPQFGDQDRYPIQVRMPEPPLLLCDRVLGIEGAPHSMGQGTIWTETEVAADSWYLHHGRMPAGIFIESGQADLLLISWLGIDRHNRGERAYRLLGCELVFHGELPAPGDTLEYEIKVDGHARQGAVRLFFFHYECRIRGEVRITVRNGQAGFFTKEELHHSAGVIWNAQGASYTPHAGVAPAPVPSTKTAFSQREVDAYLNGDLVACFGAQFYVAQTHTRTPRTPAGKHNFLGPVTAFALAGGPAGRGYMRIETPVRPGEWFFDGHFKNDPCMPGTLMAEACLQAMAFYLAGTGRTLERDGWRFQPVRDTAYKFVCRGQVTPASRQLVYELFVDEIIDGELPMLFAHVLCSVDGRKAFLCERLGLQLVPDWPLTSMPRIPHDHTDTRPLATIGGFPLDHRSLIQCAWGQPSLGFGPAFAANDGARRTQRLPGPPYHFMSRITDLQATMGQMGAQAKVTALYDLAPDAWFFTENARPTVPNCVLMEIALQPCGWLASYTLERKENAPELLFRNLDGESVQQRELVPADRTVMTEVELISVSKAGDLIIEKFKVRCSVAGEEVLNVETTFGFFPPASMHTQKGVATKPDDLARLRMPDHTRIELASHPAALFGGSGRAGLPASKLLMLSRINGCWPQGGKYGLGALRAEKDVDPGAWFFKAHFFQDPVQPGSLGIEAILQAMQSFMLLAEMDRGVPNARFEPIDIGGKAVWHYRGQVTPHNKKITVEFEVRERGPDMRGPFIIADAHLWVDGLCIYHVPRIGMRIVSGAESRPLSPGASTWQLNLARGEDAWIADHCPTYTQPALPLTYELEMMAQAAAAYFPALRLQGIPHAEARQWIAFASPVACGRLVAEPAESGKIAMRLEQATAPGVFALAATARLQFGETHAPAQLDPLEPLIDARPVDAPYSNASLFHGPSLQLMRDLRRARNGACATLDAGSRGIAVGIIHPGLLDAALHCIPHDQYEQWCDQVEPGRVAFPVRIENLCIYAALAADGEVEVHARFRALESARYLRSHLRIMRGDQALVSFDVIEALLPYSRLGAVNALARRSFLRDYRYVPGVALAEVSAASTTLRLLDVKRSDWFPGTLATVYGLGSSGPEMARQISVGDHVGQLLRLHPRTVVMDPAGRECLNVPLNKLLVNVNCDAGAVTVSTVTNEGLDWEAVRTAWYARQGMRPGFILDLGFALIRRFVRRVVLADPAGYASLRGQPVLYLANHQTGVESFLFSALIVALADTPTAAIAKQEHRASWIGRILELADLAMGGDNPLHMLFFDRTDPADMLRLLRHFGDTLASASRSLLVHVDGTRAQSGGAPVRAVSSVLIDLALQYRMPIVPVRFAGGLGIAQGAQRHEFPIGYGQQDYYLGRAIDPDALAALPYAERARFVADRINSLGPAGEADAPQAMDPEFARLVTELIAAGRTEVQAVLTAVLDELPGPSAETCAWTGAGAQKGANGNAPAQGIARRLLGATPAPAAASAP